MARKVFSHHFMVKGKGAFPVDMLRRDGCFPASSEDAVELIVDFRDTEDYTRVREVELISYGEKHWTPTDGRWKSFGWQVSNHQMYICITPTSNFRHRFNTTSCIITTISEISNIN